MADTIATEATSYLGGLFDELLTLAVLGLLGRTEADVWSAGTEFREKFGFPNPAAAVDHG
ncbi:hypothetical protein Huta_1117 [Halorhabdus utahensis DSM 12940]|uniref:Uncharacterized protein n=1 Tax=Halorhabdus utahensis (strain DSM 12940 / JCM 11049 / AX-2) TaxID=519442 RepID=C7NM88_HALUD|nr:hypothetical protein Huta_1117 [Halorhabdus utahensis DSM 12940]